ncbi:putative C-type lectin mannose binding isoform 5 variant 1 protein, partial [Naja naja]
IGADHHCPSDWISIDKFCYKLNKQRKSWSDAEASCTQRQNSSHLVSIHSRAETFHVKRLIPSNQAPFTNVWIGLNDPQKNRNWRWSDGSTFNYTAWEPMEPNDLDDEKFCAQLSSSSRYLAWEAAECESENFFICKM